MQEKVSKKEFKKTKNLRSPICFRSFFFINSIKWQKENMFYEAKKFQRIAAQFMNKMKTNGKN